MKEKHSNNQVNDLDDASFKETTDRILADIELERSLKQPFTPKEKFKILRPLYEVKASDEVEHSEKDEFGNYIIEEAGPLSPPIPRKSTPEGRASLGAMTSRRSDKIQP